MPFNDPMRQARQQGLIPAPQQAQGPQSGLANAFGTSQGQQQLNQLYGILSQGSKDPSQVGMNYVSAMQNQQRLDQENSPLGQYLKMYGQINPRDFTMESMKKFHDEWTGSGNLNWQLLERHNRMSAQEEEQLINYTNAATRAYGEIGKLNNLAERFSALAKDPTHYRTGKLAGGIDSFLRSMLGMQDTEVSLLKTQYSATMMQSMLQMLPPGVASDKDVSLALQGWPQKHDNPAYIAAYLRGVMKIRIAEQVMNSHHAAYVGTHRKIEGMADDWAKSGLGEVKDAFERRGLPWLEGPDGASHEQVYDQVFQQKFGYSTRKPAAQPGNPDLSMTVPTASDAAQSLDALLQDADAILNRHRK